MSAETFNPIIEVINGDGQCVGFRSRIGGERIRCASNQQGHND
jgi:hypothetical protein